MKTINNRLEALETTFNPSEGAWLAFIEDDTVNLSHSRYGSLILKSREAFQQWIELNIKDDGYTNLIIVDDEHCKGKVPIEL